jgi:hypothetical protein
MAENTFVVGDRVRKVSGDYQLDGIVVSTFKTLAGKVRYVVEHPPGFLHIYGGANLQHKLEREVLIHRYLYYVESAPIIPDSEYDLIEREARKVLPETSPVHKVGSSLPSDYSDNIIYEAKARSVSPSL